MPAPTSPLATRTTHSRRGQTSSGRARRVCAVALGLVTLFGAAGCSAGEAEEPTTIAATPAPDLPAASDLADPDKVVPAGEWAVVEVPKTAGSDTHIPVAVKVTSVKKGEPGDLKDVTSVTGNNELIKTGTPWYITVHWAALEGDGFDSPANGIWGWNTETDTSAMNLSLPASLRRCAEPVTDVAGGVNLEQVSCSVAMFEDSALVLDQVRYVNATTYPGSDNGIRFAVPAS